jgi:hypothetical protein
VREGVVIVGSLDQVISAVDDLIVSPGIVEVVGPRLSTRPAAGLSLLHVVRPVSWGGRMVMKALFDRVLGIWLILVGLPVLTLVAVLVKIDSRGPIP